MEFDLRSFARTFGPAWLVMIADVDVASIVTGLQSGASWGYHMVFVMLALTVPLFFIQDAAGRLGTLSGKGLGAVVREKYGRRVALMAAAPMALTDFLSYVAEYAGIALAADLLGFPVALAIAIAYAAHMSVVVSRRYRTVEAAMIPLSFLLVAALVISAFFYPVRWNEVLAVGLSPLQPYSSGGFDFLVAASAGAVVMPWMLYFHSGADARKGIRECDLRAERLETAIGAIVSEVLMAITVLDGYGLRLMGADGGLLSPSNIASVLRPLGPASAVLMAAGFAAAGFLALVVISMASAWGVLEALGLEGSRRAYVAVYALESAPAALVAALSSNLVGLMIDLMASYTLVLAPSLYLLGRLASDPEVMGGSPLRPWERALFWALSAAIVASGVIGFSSLL